MLSSSITLELNGNELSDITFYAEHAYLNALLDSTQIEKETSLFLEGWSGDGCHGKNIGDYTDAQMAARRAYKNNCSILHLEIRPKIPLFKQTKYIGLHTRLRLTLKHNLDRVCLMAFQDAPAGGAK